MTTLNLLLLAAEAALASLVLPLLATLLARACPKSAARRRLAWVMLFAVLLALPLAAALCPSLAVITLRAPAAPVPTPAITAAATTEAPLSATAAALLLGLYAWAVGVLWTLARSAPGLFALHQLKRGAQPASAVSLPLALPRGCRVLLSPDCTGPMTWGVVRPIILLPDDALSWPTAKLEAALRHELAHVRRKDIVAQVLALLGCALYWPNPLVWRAARNLRRDAEAAADDDVLASGMRPSDYASLLLDLANDWGGPRRSELEMAMAKPPILTERVQSILSPEASRTGATAMDTFKLALLGGVAVAALALARPSVADAPASPSVPADPQTQQPAPAAPQAKVAPAAPGSATIRSGAHDQVGQNTQGPRDKQAARPADQTLHLAQQDVPAPPAKAAAPAQWTLSWQPNPNGPPAPAQPAAPPGVAAAPLPPLPPTAPGQPRPRIAFRFYPNQDGQMTPEERAELNRQLASIGPKIEKALADAHIDEAVAKALKDAHIDETVDKAVKGIQPTIQKSIADAQVREIVAQRLAAVDAAVIRAQEDTRRAEEQARRAAERAQHAQDDAAKGSTSP